MAIPRVRGILPRILPVAGLVAVCMLAATIAATLAILGSGSAVLEAKVSSRVPIDYSADQVALKIPRLSPEIIAAIRRDRDRAGGESGAPGGPASPSPPHSTLPTPATSGGATPPPNSGAALTPTPTPSPLLPLPSAPPTLPVTTPTPLPLPTLPATPTLPAVPTLPAISTLPPTPAFPSLP